MASQPCCCYIGANCTACQPHQACVPLQVHGTFFTAQWRPPVEALRCHFAIPPLPRPQQLDDSRAATQPAAGATHQPPPSGCHQPPADAAAAVADADAGLAAAPRPPPSGNLPQGLPPPRWVGEAVLVLWGLAMQQHVMLSSLTASGGAGKSDRQEPAAQLLLALLQHVAHLSAPQLHGAPAVAVTAAQALQLLLHSHRPDARAAAARCVLSSGGAALREALCSAGGSGASSCSSGGSSSSGSGSGWASSTPAHAPCNSLPSDSVQDLPVGAQDLPAGVVTYAAHTPAQHLPTAAAGMQPALQLPAQPASTCLASMRAELGLVLRQLGHAPLDLHATQQVMLHAGARACKRVHSDVCVGGWGGGSD